LATVVALFSHLQEQAFKDLREREDVSRVHILFTDLMCPIQHIQKVFVGINPHAFNARHDFTDDLLTWRSVRLIFRHRSNPTSEMKTIASHFAKIRFSPSEEFFQTNIFLSWPH